MRTDLTANVIPFPPRYERGIDEALEAYMRRERARICADCDAIRLESERIQRGYEDRQKRIAKMIARMGADVERA